MKRIISMIKILLPGLLILLLIFALRGGVDILAGLFIFFPILYILFGIVCSGQIELLLGIFLADLAFLLPVNFCFNMGTCIGYAVAYSFLCVIVFWIKRGIRKKRRRS